MTRDINLAVADLPEYYFSFTFNKKIYETWIFYVEKALDVIATTASMSSKI